MTQKTYTRNYRGRLIELRQSDGGWAASFRKFAYVTFTDLGEPFPTKKEAIAHAKRYVDREVQEEEIAERFEALFDEFLGQRYPVALIFDGLATAVYDRGWSEQAGLLEQAVQLSPLEVR